MEVSINYPYLIIYSHLDGSQIRRKDSSLQDYFAVNKVDAHLDKVETKNTFLIE